MATRVLIVEDESLIAMLIEDHLLEFGYEVEPAVATVKEALARIDRGGVDLALLDVNLGGTMSFPVAEALRRRGIPFLFLTGYGRAGLPSEYADCLVLQKPFRRKDLEAHLQQLQDTRRSQGASPSAEQGESNTQGAP